jgi:hypothetical protein
VRPGSPPGIVLETAHARAEIVPEQGGRVRSLVDLASGRELHYRRPDEVWDERDYVATLAGGWDQMFPNDDPWRGFPTHGVHWTARFGVEHETAGAATLGCVLGEPAVTIEHRYELLADPRAGLRLTTRVRADAAVDSFLWSTHPMLAVGTGWRIDVGDAELEADEVDPGRVAPGRLSAAARDVVLEIPEGGQGWQEVLYAAATGEATVSSPDGRAGTRVAWDRSFFGHLWLVTLSGFATVDLALVLEPCTTRPYRLDEAIANGTAVQLERGEERTWWSEVESLDS